MPDLRVASSLPDTLIAGFPVVLGVNVRNDGALERPLDYVFAGAGDRAAKRFGHCFLPDQRA